MWKRPTDVWVNILQNAQSYEEWEEAAFQLDVLLGNDLWYGVIPLAVQHYRARIN